MKTSKQAVKLLWHTPIYIAGFAARTCYDSFKKKDKSPSGYLQDPPADKDLELINKLSNRLRHESVIEHINFTFTIRTNRAVLQQLVRHRIASYSVKSTRYTLLRALKNKETFMRNNIVFAPFKQTKVDTLEEWYNVIALLIYTKEKIKPDQIKEIIPESLLTHVTLTMNARSLKNFFNLRTSKSAWLPIKELALLMAARIAQRIGEPQFQAFFGFVPSRAELKKVKEKLYGV